MHGGLSQANHLSGSTSPLPNSDWQLDTQWTDGAGDNACDKEENISSRYVFIGGGGGGEEEEEVMESEHNKK